MRIALLFSCLIHATFLTFTSHASLLNCSTSPVAYSALTRLNVQNTSCTLGITPIVIQTLWRDPTPDSVCFIVGGDLLNLHSNENTSIVAAEILVQNWLPGLRFTHIIHDFGSGWPTRRISFQTNQSSPIYSFDPNRIFTEKGVRETLSINNARGVDTLAFNLTLTFGRTILEVYNFDKQAVVTSLHNNGPGYSAEAYLPGGVYARDASRVFIANGTNPRMFFYVTAEEHFNALSRNRVNVVLQAPVSGSLVDDGSLSVYSAMMGKQYANCETAAESGSDGTSLLSQLHILYVWRYEVLGPDPFSCTSASTPLGLSTLELSLIIGLALTLTLLVVCAVMIAKLRAANTHSRML